MQGNTQRLRRRKDDQNISSQFRSLILLNAYRFAIALFLVSYYWVENEVGSEAGLNMVFLYLKYILSFIFPSDATSCY